MSETKSPAGDSGSIKVTTAEELLRAGKALGTPLSVPAGYQPSVIVPIGYELKPLERVKEPLPALPDHLRARVRLDDADSFVAYVKAFQTHTMRIIATAPKLKEVTATSSGGAKFTAHLDYHEGGPEQKAHRAAHIAEYPVPLSIEFGIWIGNSGKAMTQDEFIKFIENNSPDLISPDSATIMEIAMNFQSTSEVKFTSKVDRVTGGNILHYQQDIEAGVATQGKMKVPEWLLLKFPVFEGGKAYDFRGRIEWRPRDGKLTISYHIQRPHEVFRAALADLRQEISAALDNHEILTGEVLHTES